MAGRQLPASTERYVSPRSTGLLATIRRSNLFFRRSIYGILFVAPAMIFFIVFSLYPMVKGST